MPPSLDSLPDELLKLIFECVQDDDKAWRDLGLVRGADDAAQATTVAASASHGGQQPRPLPASVIEGRWSAWYGRGVIALGTVNSRLRSLVRPVLYKSLDWRRIDTSFFRYLVLGEPVARLIEHVDLDFSEYGDEVPCIALASALKMLPGVTSLRLNGRPSDFTGDAHASLEDAEFLVTRIEQMLAQVRSLALSDVSASVLVDILRFVDAGSLRRLDVKLYAQEVLSNVIAGALQHLRVLETLSLWNLRLNEDWVMGVHAPLSSVRRLTIGGALRFDDALHIAAILTPNVQSLTVSTWRAEPHLSLVTARALPAGGLSHLRSLPLTLEADSSTFPTSILSLDLPSLRSLRIECKSRSVHGNLDVPLPLPRTFPAALCRISLVLHSSVTMPKLGDLAAACTATGVGLDVQRSLGRSSAVSSAPDAGNSTPKGQAAAVRETLEWALRRTNWLEELEDAQGLQEMSEAAARLRERRCLERLE